MRHSTKALPIDGLPPEIKQLIERFDGNTAKAERFAGVSARTFYKLLSGKRSFSEHLKSRALAALTATEGQSAMPYPAATIPETCPPLLAKLMRHTGSKEATFRILECSDATMKKFMTGQKEMSPEQIIKAKVALGEPVLGTQAAEAAAPPQPDIPEFVPWDGKAKANVTAGGPGGNKKVTLKGLPAPLAKLIEKFDGSRAKAAQAMGYSPSVMYQMLDGTRKFDEKLQQRVHAALHGVPPAQKNSMGEDYDRYETGFAIVMASAGGFDRIQEIAEILNGRLAFKKNTKAGWLFMYKMALADLPKFKRLAIRDANEIVCP